MVCKIIYLLDILYEKNANLISLMIQCIDMHPIKKNEAKKLSCESNFKVMGIPTEVESVLVILANTIGLVNSRETQMMIMIFY